MCREGREGVGGGETNRRNEKEREREVDGGKNKPWLPFTEPSPWDYFGPNCTQVWICVSYTQRFWHVNKVEGCLTYFKISNEKSKKRREGEGEMRNEKWEMGNGKWEREGAKQNNSNSNSKQIEIRFETNRGKNTKTKIEVLVYNNQRRVCKMSIDCSSVARKWLYLYILQIFTRLCQPGYFTFGPFPCSQRPVEMGVSFWLL